MNRLKYAIVLVIVVSLILTPLVNVESQQRNLKLTGGMAETIKRWPSREKRYALLIGVNSYEDSQITPLVGAVNDMVMLEEALVQYGGFDRDRIVRLTETGQESEIRATRPTYRNIYTRLSNILKIVPSDGLLLLAFSGHGIQRGQRAFLLPTDASVNGDIQLLERTALEVASIKEMIEDRRDESGRPMGVAQVVVLLDACRNDPTSGKDTSANALSEAYDFSLRNSNVQAFATIYATSRGGRAYENREKKQGYFIAEVVAGLSGLAANDQGEVTLAGLINYIENKVPTKVTLDLGHSQRPFMELKGYKAAELVITVNGEVAVNRARESRTERVSIPAPEPAASENRRTERMLTTTTAFTTGTMVNGALSQSQGECEVFVEDLGNGVKLEMVKIPGGKFLMGSPKREQSRSLDEGPQREVTVNSYLMGRYEVSQQIWRQVAKLPEVDIDLKPEPSSFNGDNLPVESVSWDEVKEFIERLNQKLGLTEKNGYRLPSEAEWEYAARAGTGTPFTFGETIDAKYVNYDGNYKYGSGFKGEYRKRTMEVGKLGIANGWGLFDVHGNVWEWCEDKYHASYSGAPVDGIAWTSSTVPTRRILRGGSWYDNAVGCRSAYRSKNTPGHRSNEVGFRLSRTLP